MFSYVSNIKINQVYCLLEKCLLFIREMFIVYQRNVYCKVKNEEKEPIAEERNKAERAHKELCCPLSLLPFPLFHYFAINVINVILLNVTLDLAIYDEVGIGNKANLKNNNNK